jgi:serine/threonine-protein kinase
VLAAGDAAGSPWYTMPLIEGESLRARRANRARVSMGDAVKILHDVIDALAYAHERGIVHRDIKPHNVIVDDEGNAKVTDFGIARAGASDMTETGSILGTAQYLSPEQAQGHPVSARSDLYSTGILLYEALRQRLG